MAKPALHHLDNHAQRFWQQVAPANDAGCRVWAGNCFEKGYGRFNVADSTFRANRVALYYATGVMPAKLSALHSCRNPQCCNPDHLRWGTHDENQRDKTLDRTIHGEGNPRAKLTQAQADEIKASGESTATLVDWYGVSKSTINKIRRSASW